MSDWGMSESLLLVPATYCVRVDSSDSETPAAAPSAPSKPPVVPKPVVKSKWADEDEDDNNVAVSQRLPYSP